MKTIRISDSAYKFLKERAEEEKRSMVKTLDLFIDVFKKAHEESSGVVSEGISPSGKK